MCGIVGIVDFSGLDRALHQPRLAQALARLAPRGPDGESSWFDGQCALGHRRLAIIELSNAGLQPMIGHRRVISFNGEIYNFAALRRDLEQCGRRFHTRTDTEILLAGWDEWGEALLPKLVGMFAFALWDPAERELILARDRFGKKPLLYVTQGSRTAFASDFIALEQISGETYALDPSALPWLFTLRFIPEPWSVGVGVRKLPAGHFARIRRGSFDLKQWYSTGTQKRVAVASEAEAVIGLRAAIEAAVTDRLVSDVPVGAFLSGGIDSAVVVATMAAQRRDVRTFTVGFKGAARYYEERPEARLVADAFGTKHTEIEVDLKEALRDLSAVFLALDEPFADSSAVPSYFVARETRRHVTVALSGDGADEVFAGYRKYQGELYASSYRALPSWLRRSFIEPLVFSLPEGKETRLLELARRARRFVSYGALETAARQAGWARLLPASQLEELLLSGGAPPLEALVTSARQCASASDPINEMLAAEIVLGLPSDMLVKVDRTSMANSLEVRCPFLDQRVVEYAASMPGAFKLKLGEGKAILRRAFRGILPDSVFARPKKGFELPVAQWLRDELADFARAVTDPERLRRQGLFSPHIPRTWLEDVQSGRRDSAWILWTLISFQQWAMLHKRPEAMT